jgi:hypothetical protein
MTVTGIGDTAGVCVCVCVCCYVSIRGCEKDGDAIGIRLLLLLPLYLFHPLSLLPLSSVTSVRSYGPEKTILVPVKDEICPSIIQYEVPQSQIIAKNPPCVCPRLVFVQIGENSCVRAALCAGRLRRRDFCDIATAHGRIV